VHLKPDRPTDASQAREAHRCISSQRSPQMHLKPERPTDASQAREAHRCISSQRGPQMHLKPERLTDASQATVFCSRGSLGGLLT
jgi:hypothetical protein